MIITVNILRITSCLLGTGEFLRNIRKNHWEGLEKKPRIEGEEYLERVSFPRDGGAWWAAGYGVAQSRTRLKRLSSSRFPM